MEILFTFFKYRLNLILNFTKSNSIIEIIILYILKKRKFTFSYYSY